MAVLARSTKAARARSVARAVLAALMGLLLAELAQAQGQGSTLPWRTRHDGGLAESNLVVAQGEAMNGEQNIHVYERIGDWDWLETVLSPDGSLLFNRFRQSEPLDQADLLRISRQEGDGRTITLVLRRSGSIWKFHAGETKPTRIDGMAVLFHTVVSRFTKPEDMARGAPRGYFLYLNRGTADRAYGSHLPEVGVIAPSWGPNVQNWDTWQEVRISTRERGAQRRALRWWMPSKESIGFYPLADFQPSGAQQRFEAIASFDTTFLSIYGTSERDGLGIIVASRASNDIGRSLGRIGGRDVWEKLPAPELRVSHKFGEKLKALGAAVSTTEIVIESEVAGAATDLQRDASRASRRAPNAPSRQASSFMMVEPAGMTISSMRAVVVGGAKSAEHARAILDATRERIKSGVDRVPEDRGYGLSEWYPGPAAQCSDGSFFGVLILWIASPKPTMPYLYSQMHTTCGHSSDDGVRRHFSRICGENSWGINKIAPWQPPDDIGCPENSWVVGEIKGAPECRYVIGRYVEERPGLETPVGIQTRLVERPIHCAAP